MAKVLAEDVPGEHLPGAAAAQLIDVTKRFGEGASGRIALDHVTLTIPSGALVAVTGPSGSGKSTVLHLLAGLDAPTEGEVLLEGQRLSMASAHRRSELRRRRVGMVFQAFNLLPELTALENVALPGVFTRMGNRARLTRATQLLDAVGLGGHGDQRPAELSGGEQQRVAVARALFLRPALVLADEPTGSLDSANGEALLALLQAVRRDEDATIVVATHDPMVAGHADIVLRLRDGRLDEEVS